MHRVACVCVGDKYGVEYIVNLNRALCRHTTKPFTLEVISQSRFPGWWAKLDLFPPTGRIVYLDLDVVVSGNVDFLFDYEGPFCMWKDPWGDKYNSSVMSIAPGFGRELRDYFLSDSERIMSRFYSDQEYLTHMVQGLPIDTWQRFAPGKVKSYKADHLKNGPGEAAISVFHGDPKPHTFGSDSWVSQHWQA